MDFKKAYEAALERAKGIYNENPSSSTAKFVCGQIFPELKESEGERIMKRLFTLIRVLDSQFFTGDNPSKEQCLAYLEKQKEKQPAECLKPEKDCWYVCIKDFYGGGKKQNSKGDLVQAKGGMYMMARDDISEWFRKAYYDEIKPAECSEEDDVMIGNIFGTYKTLEDMLDLSTGQDRDILESMNFEKDWLKDRFKSLRPQPHWKPSEEQMTNLINVRNHVAQASGHWGESLSSLIDDLQKL